MQQRQELRCWNASKRSRCRCRRAEQSLTELRCRVVNLLLEKSRTALRGKLL
jgi:hypothetical protein